jgi:hypothetical protein
MPALQQREQGAWQQLGWLAVNTHEQAVVAGKFVG